MAKIRRGNFIFITWIGDHSPRHVHVYKDGKMIVKWDLENDQPMEGKISAKIRAIIEELKQEGKL